MPKTSAEEEPPGWRRANRTTLKTAAEAAHPYTANPAHAPDNLIARLPLDGQQVCPQETVQDAKVVRLRGRKRQTTSFRARYFPGVSLQ